MISPIMMNRHPSKPVFYPYMYHTLDKHPLSPKKSNFNPKQDANSTFQTKMCEF